MFRLENNHGFGRAEQMPVCTKAMGSEGLQIAQRGPPKAHKPVIGRVHTDAIIEIARRPIPLEQHNTLFSTLSQNGQLLVWRW